MGARFAGMVPDSDGFNAQSLIHEMGNNGWDYLHVAGCNPARKFPAKQWIKAREKLGFLVVQDLFLTETAEEADVVLPVLAYTEKKGSFINIEGRVQKLHPGKQPIEHVPSDGEIFIRIAQKLGIHLIFEKDFIEALKQTHVPKATPVQMKTEASHANGLQAVFATVLFDQGVRMSHNEHLKEIVKEPIVRVHPNEGIQTGSWVWLKTKEGTVKAKVKADRQVAEKTVVIPVGFIDLPAYELSLNLTNGIPIELEACRD